MGRPTENLLPQFSSSSVYLSGANNIQGPHGTVIFNNANWNAEALKELRSHTAPDALHTSLSVSRQDMCTPGTQTFTLSILKSLATNSNPGSPDVVWVHGPAGAGKSAIMRTLANMLDEQGLLLASFFFFRSEIQRNTSRPFIPTLAEQVWSALPGTQAHIAQAIQRNHDLFTRPAHRQSLDLLEKPLLAALTPSDTPLSIVVDGLDECTDAGGQTEIINAMVQLASTIRARANRRVKTFIASRPEYEIKTRFDALASNPAISVIRLDDSDANLHLFYDEQLEKIRQKFGLPSSWPSKAQIKWLMDKTSGQYAFADVSTRFMYGGDPMRRLKIILEALKVNQLQPFEALDQLYATILNQLPENMRIPTVHVLRCRLHPQWVTLGNHSPERLFRLPHNYINNQRSYLASLIDFDNKMVPYHASLADFLVDPSRSAKFCLYVDDRMLSHAIQRCMLAAAKCNFANDSNVREEESPLYLMRYWPRDFLYTIVIPHPLPRAELASTLKGINPSLLSSDLSLGFLAFLEILQAQFRSQNLYFFHPALWYTIRYALPGQLATLGRIDDRSTLNS